MKSGTTYRLNWYLLTGAAVLSFLVGILLLYALISPTPSGQEKIRRSEEQFLASKIIHVLEPVVGKGNARAEVHLDLDFDTIVTNEEIYMPDGQILRSYRAEKNFASEAEYEINKTSRQVTQNGAKIRKLSVLVMVDDLRDGSLSRARSAEEMDYLASLITPVIGYNKKRGDVLKMESIRFDNRFWNKNTLVDIFWGLLILTLILYLSLNKENASQLTTEEISVEPQKTGLPDKMINADENKSVSQNKTSENTPHNVWYKISQVETDVLKSYLEKEVPAVAAYILARLDTAKSAQVIASMQTEFAAAVLACLSEGTPVSADVADEIENTVKGDFKAHTGGGCHYVLDLLKNIGFEQQKTLMTALESENFAAAEKLRNEMFNFEDFYAVADEDIKRLFDEVEAEDLALALRGASEQLQQHMFADMNSAAAEYVQKHMAELGPVRLRQVEAAQDKIIAVAMDMADKKQITLKKIREAEVK